MSELSYEAKVIIDYMNQYIASDNVDCAEKLIELKFNNKIENKLNEEQWDFIIDYVYKDLLSHSMEDGIISDVERAELEKLMNLKLEFKNTTKDAIKFRLNNSVQTVENSHQHQSPYLKLKPTPWDNEKN